MPVRTVKKAFQVLHEFTSSAQHIYLTIAIDEQIPCVMDVWTGAFGTQANFRKGVEKVVDLLIEKGYKKWLADLRKMEGSWDSSREWMLQELLPRAVKGGLMFEAIILPKDLFARLSAQDIIMQLDNYQLRQFDDLEKAQEWLKNIS
jgi:hypothetical protein